MQVLLRSQFGSVKPYTRHVPGCTEKDDQEHNDCNCPKWLYEYPRGGKPVRRSLITHSFAEAQRIAADTLRGFDPEIRQARAEQKKKDESRVTVEDACQRWLTSVKRTNGDGGVWPTYQSLTKKLIDWASRKKFGDIQDITTSALDAWASSDEWTRYTKSTEHQRWMNLRSMFSFLVERKIIDQNPILPVKPVKLDGDPVQGPYTDAQVEAMYAYVVESVKNGDPQTAAIRAKRLEAMLTLLLHTGCDLIDASQFDLRRVEQMQIDGRAIWVYQYDRHKTGIRAVIPVTDDVVAKLRSVPLLPGNSADMPFRSPASDPKVDVHAWSHQIRRLLKVAGVEYVSLPATGRTRERTKAANAKQLRHTFACRQLIAGQRPEAVARMLGHVDATMVRKHYAPFIPELKEAHVRMVIGNWR
jgi:integrase